MNSQLPKELSENFVYVFVNTGDCNRALWIIA